MHKFACEHIEIINHKLKIMKNSIKWLGAIALLIMGAFMFVSCGDDEEEIGKIASKAQIVGTWTVQSVRGEGPRVGSIIIFNSDGTAYAEGQQGSFTYDQNTGAFTFQMPGMSVVGTITISNSQLTVNYTTGEGETGTMVLSKGSSSNNDGNDSIPNNPNNPNDSIPNNPNTPNDSIPNDPITPNDSITDEPTVEAGHADVKQLIGIWIVKANTSDNIVGDTIVFGVDGYGYMGGKKFGYSSYYDSNEPQRFKCDINFSDNTNTFGKFIYAQDGNVINGEIKDSKGNYQMLVLQKPEYTIPSDGILGRWEITNVVKPEGMKEGPQVGMVLVFGQNGELYIEGDASLDSYNWNPDTNELYLSMVGQTGLLQARGMESGSVAAWSLGEEFRVMLKKL